MIPNKRGKYIHVSFFGTIYIFSVGQHWACEAELQQYNQKAIGQMRSVWGQLITQNGRDLECEKNKLRSFLDQSWEDEITPLMPDVDNSLQNLYSTKLYNSRTVNSMSMASQPNYNCTSRTKIYARRYWQTK